MSLCQDQGVIVNTMGLQLIHQDVSELSFNVDTTKLCKNLYHTTFTHAPYVVHLEAQDVQVMYNRTSLLCITYTAIRVQLTEDNIFVVMIA